MEDILLKKPSQRSTENLTERDRIGIEFKSGVRGAITKIAHRQLIVTQFHRTNDEIDEKIIGKTPHDLITQCTKVVAVKVFKTRNELLEWMLNQNA